MINNYKLEYFNNTIYLKIIKQEQNGCGLILIAGIGIIMFLLPILGTCLLITEISFGLIITWLLAWSVSVYFIRLYLWNKYGEEVFLIKDNNTLETYYDYRFFKDNHRSYQFINIEILFFIEGDPVNESKMKKEQKDQLSVIGFDLDKQIIKSHKAIPISEIKDIAKAIDSIIERWISQ